ncbi:MAG: tetratricopeptide repeat protein [Gammaproteobacteria bacterium]|nr:tetratricopeptide repeat protein [Gammaproteobacteria bacterium]
MALIETLERLLASGQDNALLRYGLGNEYLKAGRFDAAADQLRRALAHDPRYSAAWKLLGQALAAAGRTDDAIQAYENGLRAAEEKGDLQAAKEMTVFLRRLRKA